MNDEKIAKSPRLSTQFEKEKEQIKDDLVQMAGVVEECISSIVHALCEGNNQLLPDVSKTEEDINAYEMKIDEGCVEVLARRNPVACDLRLIVSAMRISSNLERMGDEAEKVVNLLRQSSLNSIPSSMAGTVKHLARQVLSMMSGSMDSFVRLDSSAARATVLKDRDIDEEYTAILRQLITYIMQEPKYIVHVINIIWCVRSLERIADHAKNIAEQVIFVDRAEDIRHTDGVDK